jgi:hypothetical protein
MREEAMGPQEKISWMEDATLGDWRRWQRTSDGVTSLD